MQERLYLIVATLCTADVALTATTDVHHLGFTMLNGGWCLVITQSHYLLSNDEIKTGVCLLETGIIAGLSKNQSLGWDDLYRDQQAFKKLLVI
eukprot:6190833-Pleurochrysis_carterae.AAC.3